MGANNIMLSRAARRPSAGLHSSPGSQPASAAKRLGNHNLARVLRDQARLDELAADPGEAHAEWPRLSASERLEVVDRMRKRFGDSFAQQFLAVAHAGNAHVELIYLQPGSGLTTKQLNAQGYRRAGLEHTGNTAFVVEIWVHPQGKTIRRDVSQGEAAAASPVDFDNDPQRCLVLLKTMQKAGLALSELSQLNPFPEAEAVKAQEEFNRAMNELHDRQYTDMTDIRENFWLDAITEVRLNEVMRKRCCKSSSNKAFACKSVDQYQRPFDQVD